MPETVHELTDEEIVRRVLGGETELFEAIVRRYNQRLFRAARAILRDDDAAEDVMQEAYLRAFTKLDQFAGEAQVLDVAHEDRCVRRAGEAAAYEVPRGAAGIHAQ